MKFPSAAPGPADRKKVWSCLLSNLAMPGVGSLTGGRGIGCGQLIFGAVAVRGRVAVAHPHQIRRLHLC